MSRSAASTSPSAPPETTQAPSSEPSGHVGIRSLTPEQIRTWSLEQKDRWWLANVYRGDMPQLTVRSALTGMLLGGALSLSNLYVGAQVGWSLGVGITSVILSFALFKILAASGVGREMTILENNAMQSIATSAGYMTSPLISSLTAYMWQTGTIIPLWQVILWMMSVSVLGVLFAFPLKKRFINDEQLPFPEGAAAGVVMEALHRGEAREGIFKAMLLAVTGGFSALMKVIQSDKIMGLFHVELPDVNDWIYRLVSPSAFGVEWQRVGVTWEWDFVMMAAGGLMGIEAGASLLIGGVLNYCILVPWAASHGDIHGTVTNGITSYSFRQITVWALWTGVAMMTTSSLLSFFAKPAVILSSLRALTRKRGAARADPLKDIELPLSVSIVGVPIAGIAIALMAHGFFGVSIWMALLAVPMVFVFAIIAVNATGLTSITPSGPLAKLTQFTYGVIAPRNIPTNLIAASITAEVAMSSSNLLMDIKPGYMLGGKPRHQAVGHVLGILAGSCVAAPVFFFLFVRGHPETMTAGHFKYPAATVWQAVAKVLTEGLSALPGTAKAGALCGAIGGIVMEGLRIATKGRFWLSAVGVGLAFVIQFPTCVAMAFGSFFFWAAARVFKDSGSLGFRVLVENREATAAGVIAGGGVMGIIVTAIELFVLK